jgi:hypothetical protein
LLWWKISPSKKLLGYAHQYLVTRLNEWGKMYINSTRTSVQSFSKNCPPIPKKRVVVWDKRKYTHSKIKVE